MPTCIVKEWSISHAYKADTCQINNPLIYITYAPFSYVGSLARWDTLGILKDTRPLTYLKKYRGSVLPEGGVHLPILMCS